jgi:hypothetical protein
VLQLRKGHQRIEQRLRKLGRTLEKIKNSGEFRLGLNAFPCISERSLGFREGMSIERARWRKHVNSRLSRRSGRTLHGNDRIT